MLHVLAAGFGLDGEAGRHGQPGVGHLGEAGAFAAELVLHLAVTFGVAVAEEVDVLYGVLVGSRIFQFSSRSAHGESFIRWLQSIACYDVCSHHGNKEEHGECSRPYDSPKLSPVPPLGACHPQLEGRHNRSLG